MAPAWTSADLDAAVAGVADPGAAADRRCGACVRLLEDERLLAGSIGEWTRAPGRDRS